MKLHSLHELALLVGVCRYQTQVHDSVASSRVQCAHRANTAMSAAPDTSGQLARPLWPAEVLDRDGAATHRGVQITVAPHAREGGRVGGGEGSNEARDGQGRGGVDADDGSSESVPPPRPGDLLPLPGNVENLGTGNTFIVHQPAPLPSSHGKACPDRSQAQTRDQSHLLALAFLWWAVPSRAATAAVGR